MSNLGRWFAAFGLLLGPLPACFSASVGGQENLASRVVVVANASDPDSVRLARYYARKRGVPADNIIALPMSSAETIGWPEFIATIYQPLQDALVARKWIDAFSTTLTDRIGRKRYGIYGERISYLVVCRGVPLRVSDDPGLRGDESKISLQPGQETNAGAVDSELTLLAHSTYEIDGWTPNPLYGVSQTPIVEAEPVVKVARIDGPTYADAAALVDHALEAERTGLLGRFYVKVRGPHSLGEQWLEKTASEIAGLGFDGDVDRTNDEQPVSARFDAPAFYFGWYSQDFNGPMTLPGFRFPAGAIALHIHSFSARTLRSTTLGWCGPMIARGVTATFGNVFEPYLELTLDPSMLLRALKMGWDLGDAAYFATPALSWQTIVIGDPLYRPFKVSEDEQMEKLDRLPQSLACYAVLRKARLLDQEKKNAEALRLVGEEFRQRPDAILALALAPRMAAAGDRAGAVRTLCKAFARQAFDLRCTPLAQEAAKLLIECGSAPRALEICRAILRNRRLGREWRSAVLRQAIAAAQASQDSSQEGILEAELNGRPAP